MSDLTYRGQKIVTDHVYPPIPDRRWDWSAVTDEYDGAPDAGWQPHGWGRTEAEAIADLKVQLDDAAEEERLPASPHSKVIVQLNATAHARLIDEARRSDRTIRDMARYLVKKGLGLLPSPHTDE